MQISGFQQVQQVTSVSNLGYVEGVMKITPFFIADYLDFFKE